MAYGLRSAFALLLGSSTCALIAAGDVARAQTATALDPITILATKTEEKAIEALAAVSTVRKEQIEMIAPTRTSELFFGLPGVWSQERGDLPETAINIRGLQDFGRVAVTVDGARQNFQRSGHNANGTFFLEPELLAGLDIVRGPVANIYGSGAIGGVASFRTKDTDDILKLGERFGGQAHGMFGDNRVRGLGSLFLAARPNANVDIFAGGTLRGQDNYMDGIGNEVPNTANEVQTGIGKVTVRPADGHEVKLSAIAYEANYNTGQSGPSAELAYRTRVDNNIFNARWKYQRPEDRIFDFDINTYWTTTEQNQVKIANGSPASNGNPITGFINDTRKFGIDTKGFDANNTTRFDTGPFRHAFTYGGDLFEDQVENVDTAGNGAITTPSGKRSVGGAFGQWKMNYSTWLEFIGALRYDNYKLEGGPSNATAGGDHISPKATLGLTPIAGMTFYGTYAEGYRAPAVTETLVSGAHPPFATGFANLFTFVPNTSLRPEIGQNKEIGVNLKYDNIFKAGDAFRGKFSVFRNDISDYIDMFTFGPPVVTSLCVAPNPAPPPACFFAVSIPTNSYSFVQYRNIDKARIEGFEFETTYDAGEWYVGLSGQTLRGRDLVADQGLGNVQPDQIAATYGVRLLDRKFTAQVRWLGVAAKPASQIPDRDANGYPDYLPTPAYGIVNVAFGYSPTPDVLATLAIDNVFNQYYVPYLNGGVQIPGQSAPLVWAAPGITVKAGLQIRFGVI